MNFANNTNLGFQANQIMKLRGQVDDQIVVPMNRKVNILVFAGAVVASMFLMGAIAYSAFFGR